MSKATGTAVYARQHKGGLTLPQLSAVDLLAAGKTDKETAELLNLSRTGVTKWRLYSPTFAAALNERRAAVWGAGVDRLRALIPQALDVLANLLQGADEPMRFKAAIEVLKLGQVQGGGAGIGATDPEDIVRARVRAERERAERDADEDELDDMDDMGCATTFEDQIEQTWEQLEKQANEPEGSGE